jgi:hypothetical protein
MQVMFLWIQRPPDFASALGVDPAPWGGCQIGGLSYPCRQTGNRPAAWAIGEENGGPLQLINQQKLGIRPRSPLALLFVLAQTLQIILLCGRQKNKSLASTTRPIVPSTNSLPKLKVGREVVLTAAAGFQPV